MSDIKRVGILFSGGPAPAANAVIAAAAVSFMEHGREVLGFFHGYSNLEIYDPVKRPMIEGQHYKVFHDAEVRNMRNERGVRIGTARANPGAGIKKPADLDDAAKTAKLRAVYDALISLNVDALVSIGGDDTLKTANFLYEFQNRLPAGSRRVRVIHLPKTIDNDYRGIDFTFGFFTAVDVMAKELQNLRADAQSTGSYFIVETMGRKAGWIAYGVAIAGEADLCIAVEDATRMCTIAQGDDMRLDVNVLADRIIDTILEREKHDEHSGAIVLAEGLAEMLPDASLEGIGRDQHGHISLGKMDLGKMVAEVVSKRYKARTGRSKKLTGVQLGYEARCAPPHAFDVMLGSQLGIGAFRGLVEQDLDGHMVSTRGQLDLCWVAFAELINPDTLTTEVRLDRHRQRLLPPRPVPRAPHVRPRRDQPGAPHRAVIHVVTTARHSYTWRAWLTGFGADVKDRVCLRTYEGFTPKMKVPGGAWIFADLERVSVGQAWLAASLHGQIAELPGFRCLNHPLEAQRRYRLLRSRYDRGLNAFDIRRANDRVRLKRFPQFIRREDDHDGPRSGLLHTEAQVDRALIEALARGANPSDLLIVEFVDTRGDDGVYRKYGATRVGDRIVPRHVLFDTGWIVKTPHLRDDRLDAEDLAFLHGDPHRDQVRAAFDDARIAFGRIDYAVKDGQVQVFEINTNPIMMMIPERYGPEALTAQRWYAARIAEAVVALDADLPPAHAKVALSLPPVG